MAIQTEFPPRGSGIVGRDESPPSEVWGHPDRLGEKWDWKPGNILLGHWRGRELGIADNRHIMTIAGTQTGKSSTVLKHNLATWPGSVVVLDPKGELAKETADVRRAMGQDVHVLDPFGITGFASSSYNPFSELGFGRPDDVAADASLLADALIIPSEREPHWTDSAHHLLRAFVLHLLSEGAL